MKNRKKSKGKYPNFYKGTKFKRTCTKCSGRKVIITGFYPWIDSQDCPLCGGKGYLG